MLFTFCAQHKAMALAQDKLALLTAHLLLHLAWNLPLTLSLASITSQEHVFFTHLLLALLHHANHRKEHRINLMPFPLMGDLEADGVTMLVISSRAALTKSTVPQKVFPWSNCAGECQHSIRTSLLQTNPSGGHSPSTPSP